MSLYSRLQWTWCFADTRKNRVIRFHFTGKENQEKKEMMMKMRMIKPELKMGSFPNKIFPMPAKSINLLKTKWKTLELAREIVLVSSIHRQTLTRTAENQCETLFLKALQTRVWLLMEYIKFLIGFPRSATNKWVLHHICGINFFSEDHSFRGALTSSSSPCNQAILKLKKKEETSQLQP